MRCFQHFISTYSLRRSWRFFWLQCVWVQLWLTTRLSTLKNCSQRTMTLWGHCLRSTLLFDVFAIPSDLHRCRMMLNVVLLDVLHASWNVCIAVLSRSNRVQRGRRSSMTKDNCFIERQPATGLQPCSTAPTTQKHYGQSCSSSANHQPHSKCNIRRLI